MTLTTLTLLPFLISSVTFSPNGSVLMSLKAADSIQFLVKTNSDIVLNVPFVHQTEGLTSSQQEEIGGTACGPAAIAMVLNFLGDDVVLVDVINRLPPTVYIKGDRFYDLYAAAQYFSRETVRFENSVNAMYEALSSGHPVVLNIQNYDGITGHAVVVVGIRGFDGKGAKSLIVHDPFVEGYREFEYVDEGTLQQPEGYLNPIGILAPFYVI
jgi:hypothetical protein